MKFFTAFESTLGRVLINDSQPMFAFGITADVDPFSAHVGNADFFLRPLSLSGLHFVKFLRDDVSCGIFSAFRCLLRHSSGVRGRRLHHRSI